MKIIKPIKITKKNFAKFGELINTKKGNPININNGYAKSCLLYTSDAADE